MDQEDCLGSFIPYLIRESSYAQVVNAHTTLPQGILPDLVPSEQATSAYQTLPVAAPRKPCWDLASAMLYLVTGRDEEYLDAVRDVLASRGDEAGVAEVERIAAAGGPRAVARWHAEHPERADPFQEAWKHRLASAALYSVIGQADLPLAALESVPAYSLPAAATAWPAFDPIRDTPRFRALLDRMGLTPFHEKYGVFERARKRFRWRCS